MATLPQTAEQEIASSPLPSRGTVSGSLQDNATTSTTRRKCPLLRFFLPLGPPLQQVFVQFYLRYDQAKKNPDFLVSALLQFIAQLPEDDLREYSALLLRGLFKEDPNWVAGTSGSAICFMNCSDAVKESCPTKLLECLQAEKNERVGTVVLGETEHGVFRELCEGYGEGRKIPELVLTSIPIRGGCSSVGVESTRLSLSSKKTRGGVFQHHADFFQNHFARPQVRKNIGRCVSKLVGDLIMPPNEETADRDESRFPQLLQVAFQMSVDTTGEVTRRANALELLSEILPFYPESIKKHKNDLHQLLEQAFSDKDMRIRVHACDIVLTAVQSFKPKDWKPLQPSLIVILRVIEALATSKNNELLTEVLEKMTETCEYNEVGGLGRRVWSYGPPGVGSSWGLSISYSV